jgi:hypothetical protein
MMEFIEIVPGYRLPPFEREGTLHHWNRFAAVNSEFADHHMDDQVGRDEGFAGAFIMAPLEHAYFHSLLREWIGDSGWILRVDIRLRNPLCRGRILTATAEVTAVRHEDTGVIVDLDLLAEDDQGLRLAPGGATVLLFS